MNYALLNLPCESDAARNYGSVVPQLNHSVYGWLGLRPALAQHTAAEHAALKRWAAVRMNLVEIGVAEGVSAMAMREVMAEGGTLSLIDPFHLSRVPALNFVKRVAHRAVGSCRRGTVRWIEEFSFDAVRAWNSPIDLLVIDGDHSENGVQRDWDDWSRFIAPGGVVIFHDAHIFEGGWTSPAYGPVKLVNNLFRDQKLPGWRIAEETDSLVAIERRV